MRVEYDIETTIKKIYAIPDLENFLGELRVEQRHYTRENKMLM